MIPTLFLMNGNDVWDLKPSMSKDDNISSFFDETSGFGCQTKNSYSRVENDFILTEEDPQQVDITGTMYFKTHTSLDKFGEFCGDFNGEVRMYYEPEGKYQPGENLTEMYYKVVRLTKFESEEQLSGYYGIWKAKCTFTPDSAMWKRDVTTSSTVEGVSTKPHMYNYMYPYYYSSGSSMNGTVQNDGAKCGCTITIENDSDVATSYISWILTAEDGTEQLAYFKIALQPGETFVVDSNALTQDVYVISSTGSKVSAVDNQEPNPEYINFVSLRTGKNTFTFSSDVEVEKLKIDISYQMQVRAL